ncbi:MAG: DNA polymerase I [Bacteroidia bacterium]|jgi:DNA polymerase-1|nr:DNA polymerase I [Bacteroidia bacterium]
MKKLFLLDAYALIYRAYFAFSNSPRINSKGLNTSAVFGFTNTLLDLLKKEQPTHIAVVFDTAAPTQRHVDYEHYKANRQEMPEDLRTAVPYIYQLLDAFNITTLESDGYEADDIIGTLAKKAEAQGFITYMMTPDKDYGQVVSENIFIYKPGYKGGPAEKLGVKEVCARYGIERTEQVIDILGLMGDSVDNIPGIPGVGEKTAIALIQQFGSVENLLANTDKLKGKQKEKVEQHGEQAIFSKKLATILLDAPVELNEEQLLYREPDKEKIRSVFTELEFRRLMQIVLGEEPAAEEVNTSTASRKTKPGQFDIFGNTGGDNETEGSDETAAPAVHKTIADTPHTYELADTPEKRAQLISQLSQLGSFCFDSETTGLDAHNVEVVGLSFSWHEGTGWYVPVPENQDEAKALLEEFRPVFENEKIGKTGQNIKYDLSVLQRYGIALHGPLFDTMIAHYLLQPDMRHNMDILAETYLHYSPVSIETLIGKKGKDQKSMRDVPLEQIKEYAAEDADVTFQLRKVFEPELESSNVRPLFDTVEMPLVPVLAAMEAEGITLDTATLAKQSAALAEEIAAIDKHIQELAGTPFNISSPKQVGDILFEVLAIGDKPKKTRTGQYATSEDILQKLVGKHPIVEQILNYREMVKLKSTYVDSLPQMVNPRTGRVHTSYNQVVAATGRLSSDNPNLQNIPIRTARGREVRKAFVPRGEGWTLLSADYSQIELRIIAALSKDPGMTEAFHKGYDIHTATAARVFGVTQEEVTREMRSKAKAVNFGIIYGQSAFGLSQSLNIPRREAQEIISQYFIQYSAIKDYMDTQMEFAREHGYVETILGRRRYLRDINSSNAVVRGFAERNAINAPIQGSAADMIKVAMINIHHALRKMNVRTRLLLQVHDELVFDVPLDEVELVKPVIEEAMRNAVDLGLPVEVGMGTGDNWLDAH